MSEPYVSAQTEQLSRKTADPKERAGRGNEISAEEMKAVAVGSANTANLKARKRTKTGCLTCRKRRIKCGEERPTCKNCVKSKRDCEGYIPRVIFKDPLGAFNRGQPGIAVRSHHGPTHNGAMGVYGALQTAPAETPIAPRLPVYMQQPSIGHGVPRDYYNSNGYDFHGKRHSTGRETFLQQQFPQNVFPNGDLQHTFKVESLPEAETHSILYPTFQQQSSVESDHTTQVDYSDPPSHWLHGSDPPTTQMVNFPPMFVRNPTLPSPANAPQNPPWPDASGAQYQESKPTPAPHSVPSYPIVSETKVEENIKSEADPQPWFYGPPAEIPWTNEPEDDYFDVDSDDEGYDIKSAVGGPLSYNLGSLIAMSANHSNGGTRSMTNYLTEPNVLATYRPSYAASPLMDPQTARVFCHFVTATAPTLTVCERRPSNPAAIFSGLPVPKSQRALWSYIMPMLALSHQGLLHAMLALASLHIAKLQRSSTTPSLKHYHYALRRVAKALGNPTRRKDVATLAATLLLGFYEVTTAEHNKWNSHLSGARELIMDIDFAGMAKKIENQRRRQEEAEANNTYQMLNGYAKAYHHSFNPTALEEFPPREDRQLDENLISTIIGYKLRYNQYGHVIEDIDPPGSNADAPLTDQDIEDFEIQCDLFWWYAKQDMIQSLVSRNRLLLSYDKWSLCPPRAPVGRLDAVCGSMDHLLLLMGRLVDFAAKDLPRKLRAQEEAQKRLRTQSSSMGIPTTQASPHQGPPNGMQGPPMYGMIPNPGRVRVPSGFDQAQHDRIYTTPLPSEDKSLDLATHEAETEWATISHAFDAFFNSLGPAYAPLEPEHMTPMATPFGPALYYRSYAIACVLTHYFCGRVVCMRVKPSMPPAAMAAAGVAAPLTAHHANTIGRIVGGIQPVDNTAPINPHHGAALMDCCMGFFHAGIQYMDPGQRGWTIARLRDIARLTGWQTSALIANGCERAWVKAAEMGRGPPYNAVMNHAAKDDRVSGRGRDPDHLQRPARDNNDRRFIHVNAGTRVYWAVGLLGAEEDLRGLKLD